MELRINENIRAPYVTLISADGKDLGQKSLHDALAIAEEIGLDLVEVAPNAQPPVCKIMNYGKHKFQQKKKRKKAQTITVKEIKLRINIGTHDMETKANAASRILEKGDKVRVIVQFRGREITHAYLGKDLSDRFVWMLRDKGIPEGKAVLTGKFLYVTLKPL